MNDMEKRSRSSRNKKQKKSGFKLVRNIIIGLVALLVIGASAGFFFVNSMLGKIDNVDINKENLGLDKDKEDALSKYGNIQNIALFGIDSDKMEGARSDSMMILTIDRENKKLKLNSLMRDSYVEIAGRKGRDKLNHAYAFGGPELAIRTINENFGLNIKDFAAVNFATLPKIIDVLGGVDIEVDSEELKYVNNYIADINAVNGTNATPISSTGMVHMNGTQAMGYARIRYTSGGDYKRTERHREILDAIFKEAKSIDITKLPKLLNEVLPMVKTSLSSSDILKIGTDVLTIGGNMEQDRFPKDEYSKSEMIDGIYYLKYDEEATKKQLHEYIFEDK